MFAALKQSSFLRHNAVFFFGSVLVGALNYAYYPVLGRLMDPVAFGEIQVLVSFFLQFTIFLNVLSMITVNIMANYDSTKRAHRMIFELEKLAVFAAVGILAATLLGGDFMRQQLQFESSVPFTALALALLVSIPLTFRSAYARGQKKFGVASVSLLLGAGVKIVLSSLLVIAGLGVAGAIFGIVGAQLLAFVYAAWWAARLGLQRPSLGYYGRLPALKPLLPELKYASFVFVGLLAVTLMMSVDVILVKYYFDAHTAGLYAGIATVARIIFFLAVPIAQVLIPMVKVNQTARKNYQLLAKSLGLTVIVCGVTLVACIAMPEFLVKILMGGQYAEYANLLPLLALVVFIISVVNLVVMYYLALRHKMIVLVGIIGFAVLVGFVLTWHDDVHAIVRSMLFGSTFTLLATGIYVVVNLRRGLRNANKDDLNHRSDL